MAFRYTRGHETQGNRTATGDAAPTGNPIAKSGEESVGSGTSSELFCEFGVSMVPNVSEERSAGITPPSHSGSTAHAFQGTEGCAGESAFERAFGRRVSDGCMDIAADGRGDRKTVRRPISPQPCMEGSVRSGVELPETGAEGIGTGRGRHCALGEVPVASYKKRPQGLVPTLYFLMNPGSCSSQTLLEHGRREGIPPSCTITTGRTGYPPSAPLLCPPGKDGYRCISDSAREISQAWMSGVSSDVSLRTSGGMWSCCGTEEQSIAVQKLHASLVSIGDFMMSSSLHMPLSLTPRNMFGTGPIVLSRTAHLRTCLRSRECFDTRCARSGVPKTDSGRAFMLQDYHGVDEYFHYLCKAQ
jgi:hypothetical protein